MVLLLESVFVCLFFTVFVAIMAKDPVKTIYNYPPAIVKRAEELGLVNPDNRPGGKAFYIKKCFALVLFGVLLGLLVRFVNHADGFWQGALLAYVLWCVGNIWDALVMDCLWFCHDKRFIIPGTEDMTEAYHDYWFHIKGSLIGMAIGIPAALIAGLIVIIA